MNAKRRYRLLSVLAVSCVVAGSVILYAPSSDARALGLLRGGGEATNLSGQSGCTVGYPTCVAINAECKRCEEYGYSVSYDAGLGYDIEEFACGAEIQGDCKTAGGWNCINTFQTGEICDDVEQFTEQTP